MDVNLTVDGKCHRFLVHVLVLTAFAGPCPLGMEALHGGSGPSCNWWPLNLRWGTRSENVRQMWAEGHRDIRGKKHPNYKHGRYVRQEQK